MFRPLIAAVAVVVTLPLFAQIPADTGVALRALHQQQDTTRVPLNARAEFHAIVSSNSETPVTVEVDLTIPGATIEPITSSRTTCDWNGSSSFHCTIRNLTADDPEYIITIAHMNAPGVQTASVWIVSPLPDADPANDRADAAIDVSGLPSLAVVPGLTDSPSRLEPGKPYRFNTTVLGGGATATAVTVTNTLTNGGTFTAVRAAGVCSLAPQQVVCTFDSLAPAATLYIQLDVTAPERTTGGPVTMHATVTSAEGDYDPRDNSNVVSRLLVRQFAVTNANDEGEGSLRQAILQSQALCDEPCAIVFRVPQVPASGRLLFTPRSPLPEVRGFVTIDGLTQRELTPNATVEIHGDQAGLAHGLLLGSGCEIRILNLGIFNFRRPGIEAHRGSFDQSCTARGAMHPYTVIAGNTVARNYRGIVIADTDYAAVTDNVVEKNRRAGLFFDRVHYVAVLRNTIVQNGASGIFFNVGSRQFDAGGAEVRENTISRNSEWGIARTHTGDIHLNRNAIFANGLLAIDVGLDLETPNRERDDLTSVPNKPVLFSAHYDASADRTIVRGRLDTTHVAGSGGFQIDVYASTRDNRDLEQWAGSLRIPATEMHDEFTIEVEGDLRGKFMTATSTRSRLVGFHTVRPDTSEASNPVRVQ